jgi:hypothetical protein
MQPDLLDDIRKEMEPPVIKWHDWPVLIILGIIILPVWGIRRLIKFII